MKIKVKKMSLIPAFKLGLWNAWILMLPDALSFPIFINLAKDKNAPSPQMDNLSKNMVSFCIFSKFIYFPAVLYSIFLPLKLGTIWFYIGLPVTLIGLVTYIIVLVNWAKTPPGRPVTTGLYRYSRHPMYVTSSLYFLGVSIVTASWVFLLFTFIIAVGIVVFIDIEEQYCIDQYGNYYCEYMSRTPRWIGILKSKLLDGKS
jgi:protein-S-isoprenylcysteine O-methyltransferase Ste14